MDLSKYSHASTGSLLCAGCGIPADAEYFDVSDLKEAPLVGRAVVLAAFTLPPQYCGVLQYFSQYTDLFAKSSAEVDTPGLVWTIRSNGRPLYPYIDLKRIVNPWGFGSFPVAIRLDDNAAIEFIIRNIDDSKQSIKRVGGRILGRYWYNAAYGDVAR
ncbi:MAG TPA: hypothetical protein VJ692_07220 [Nitrospiraceae bacterium]|nr:hypothetical protein [Nitrospiraceae bacterium]